MLTGEGGKVIRACGQDETSRPALVGTSEIAAYNSSFTPTKLGGKPVGVSGTIIYSFVAQ